MKASYIDYSETNSFSPAVISYLEENEKLKSFISEQPTLDGFTNLLQNKKVLANRSTLVSVLKSQYSSIFNQVPRFVNSDNSSENDSSNSTPIYKKVEENISLLEDENTFTVTTGHQLNIFTGPLYFIFKIVTAIKLAEDLKLKFPNKNFVPVYWMATEDHDFAEINHTFIAGKKISWNKDAFGATGRLSTNDIQDAIKEYTAVLGISENALELSHLIETAYTDHPNLADATRYLVNNLFGQYGLIVVDADSQELKTEFKKYIEKDIIDQSSFDNITSQTEKLTEAGIETQVNPREINFFYLLDNLRERIVFESEIYKVLNTDISFSESELTTEIQNHPERFSPNVVMRPLYQEVILPNIAYIGGGAEIVYWLQLKQNFDHYKVDFPILILRNSALISTYSLDTKLRKQDLILKDIFRDEDLLEKEWVIKHSQHTLNLNDEWQELKCIFEKIKLRAHKIDATLSPSTEAVKVRLEKAISNLEKKMIKADKRNYSDSLNQIRNIKAKLFPKGGLQERSENFGLLYVKYGQKFIETLLETFKPLDFKFTILQDDQSS